MLRVPGVSDIIDFAGGNVKLFGMNIEPDNWVAGRTLEELDRAGPPKNSLVAMIFRGSQVIIPHGGERLEAGDHAYVITRAADLHARTTFLFFETFTALGLVYLILSLLLSRVQRSLERNYGTVHAR